RARLHRVALLEVLRRDDVPLLAVGVVQQRDPGGPVRVVLDVGDLGRHAVLVNPLEVDQPVLAFVPTALMPGSDLALRVTTAPAMQRAYQRLLRRRPGDLGEVGDARPATTGSRRLVLANSHCLYPSAHRAAEGLDPVALSELHDRALGVVPL